MHKTICAIVACLFVFAGAAHAMTSTNFTINWDSVNSGGDDVSTSTNFLIRDTLGEQAVGFSSSTNFQLRAGYRQGDSEATILSFNVNTQVNATETAYSAFSNAGKTVTVASVAHFSVGDFIGIVENKGASQLIAIGKIASIVGTLITVDKWDGDPGSLSAVPAAGDDFVYRLTGGAADLGTLTIIAAATSLTHTSVISNVDNGYTVYVNSDGNLRYGTSTSITNVSDGTVTAGSEEYGGRVYGTTATSTGSDFAFTTSTREVQKSTTYGDDDRIGLIYKAAIDANTPAGNYSQFILYTLIANF